MSSIVLNDALRALFYQLQKLKFDLAEKPSGRENLTDILEIVAVAAGIKPAHVNGQGTRSETLLLELEKIASERSLLALRTHPILPYLHRSPNYDSRFAAWQDEQTKQECLSSPFVLWIYKDSSLKKAILNAVNGGPWITRVLGYPECCVVDYSEKLIRFSELLVGGYKTQYNATSTEDFIRLSTEDASVEVDDDEYKKITKLELLPFVQIFACDECLAADDTPATLINSQMRDLAQKLSAEFAKEIISDFIREFGTKPGRNDACPCRSGQKYKKCCGRG